MEQKDTSTMVSLWVISPNGVLFNALARTITSVMAHVRVPMKNATSNLKENLIESHKHQAE